MWKLHQKKISGGYTLAMFSKTNTSNQRITAFLKVCESHQKDQVKLQRMQNRSLRLIFPNCPSTDEVHALAWLSTLETRAITQLQYLMFRRSFNNQDYPLLPNAGLTRSHNKIRFDIPRPRVRQFKSFPLYQGAIHWDSLPAHI